MYTNILKDYNTLLGKVTSIKEMADEEKCYGTSSLMDEYIAAYNKIIWMLNQSMK